jgi:DNA polymerase I-like protein with 3'-5' exonuclease and polymerase domains
VKRLVFDIETNGLLDECHTLHSLCIVNPDSGKAMSCTGNSKGKPHGFMDLATGLAELASADQLIGHNIICFDLPALRKLYPDLELTDNVQDTLVLSRLVFSDIEPGDHRLAAVEKLPKKLIGTYGLKAWGYRLGTHKGDFGEDTDWAEWSPAMQKYCEQDTRLTQRLHQHLVRQGFSEESSKLEHDFRRYIFWQERCGFGFDERKATALYAEMRQRLLEYEAQLQSIFPPRVETLKSPAYWKLHRGDSTIQAVTKADADRERKERGWAPKDCRWEKGPPRQREIPFNPGSRKQVAERLIEKYGWKPDKLTDSGQPQIDESVLSSLPYPEAEDLAGYFMMLKRVGQIAEGSNGWLRVVKNGRIHGRVITNGAVTGRCTHASPNLAQIPSSKVEFGDECRELFVPASGWKLVGSDADGLELRCLGHFLARHDDGQYAATILEGSKDDGTDIHSTNCRAIGLDPKSVYEESGKPQTGRDIAKTFIYGWLYGAGSKKIGSIVYGAGTPERIRETQAGNASAWKTVEKRLRKYGSPTPADIALTVLGDKLKDRFLKALPALRLLSEGVQQRVKSAGALRGLDGRTLPIRSDHAALNTLLQSAGALVMKKALCLFVEQCELDGLRIARDLDDTAAVIRLVGNIHDEVQMEARPETAEEAGRRFSESIRLAGEHFNFRCPLAGSYDVGDSWKETH